MSIKVDGAEWQGCSGEGRWQLALLLVVFTQQKISYLSHLYLQNNLWSVINDGYWVLIIFCNKTGDFCFVLQTSNVALNR